MEESLPYLMVTAGGPRGGDRGGGRGFGDRGRGGGDRGRGGGGGKLSLVLPVLLTGCPAT